MTFTSLSKLCKNARSKPLFWAKSTCFDFSSSNFNLQSHILSTSGVALNRDAPQHLTRYIWVEFMAFLQSLHGPCTMTKSSNLVWKTRILITSLHQLAPCFVKLQTIRDQGGITQWAIMAQWIKHLHCQGYIPYTAYLDILALSDIHLLLKTGKDRQVIKCPREEAAINCRKEGSYYTPDGGNPAVPGDAVL